MASSPHIGRRGDFDFLRGKWNVMNRRLRRRHEGSSDWDVFAGTSEGWTLLDGSVSVDEIRFPDKSFAGCTVRTLDHAAQTWSIYWINSNVGGLFPPVVGGFAGDRGEFYGEDTDEGLPVDVRFIWHRAPGNVRWEQAFALAPSPPALGERGAPDRRRWEVNWVMEFTRV